MYDPHVYSKCTCALLVSEKVVLPKPNQPDRLLQPWYIVCFTWLDVVKIHSHSHQILMCGDIFLSGTQGPQLKDLVLIKVTEWYELGLQLGVEDAELEEIEKNNRGDLKASRRNMFRAWLRITPNPSYQQLAEALMAVGEAKAADLLCKKYSKLTVSCVGWSIQNV